MADNKKPRVPHPNDPVMPADYNPDHDKEYPHESTDITGEKEQHLVEEETYETDMRDEEGRPPSMRRTGQFIVPDDEETAGEGWTLPTRPGGGWDHPLEQSLEEQIDEPETPQDVNNK